MRKGKKSLLNLSENRLLWCTVICVRDRNGARLWEARSNLDQKNASCLPKTAGMDSPGLNPFFQHRRLRRCWKRVGV